MVDGDVNQGPSVVDNRVLKNRLMAATRDPVGGAVGGLYGGANPQPPSCPGPWACRLHPPLYEPLGSWNRALFTT